MEYDKDAFVSYLTGKVDQYVKQGARDTIVINAKRDKAKVRCARIPGGKACDFCKMLGSRGFVYHSEESAGAYSDWHPRCNCQIAIAFDVVQEEYWKGWTKVTRGFSAENKLVKKGADGKSELRPYDPDELFETYKQMGKKFSPSKSKIFKGKPRRADQELSPFASTKDMASYINEAASIDDLKDRCEVVERWWNSDTYTDKSWNSLRHQVQEMKKAIVHGAVTSIEIDELTPCLRRLSDGRIVQTSISVVRPKRGDFVGWDFDWMTQAKDGGEVRALKADGDDRVQGLLATTDEADSKYVYVVLVESAPFNKSQKKEYNGVGAHLFAEAVKISYELGYNGVVAFDAKTELFEYYTKAMYATRLGTSQRMIIDEAGAKKLYERYYGKNS